MTDAKKAITTLDFATSALGLIKSGALIFFMVLLEWARQRAKLAENKEQVAKANLDVKNKQDAIQKEANEKSSDEIINEFLDRK